MHAEHNCELAAGGNTVTGAKVACMYQGTKLVAQLDVKRNVAFRLQMDRKHWLSLRPILHEIGLLQEPICLPGGGRDRWDLVNLSAGGSRYARWSRLPITAGCRVVSGHPRRIDKFGP